MLRSPLASLLSVCVVLACVAGCVPSRPEFDSWWPDVPRRDDGGTDDADVDGGEEDGETEVPPLPRETEDNDPFHGGTAEPLDAPTTIAGNIGFPAADHPDWDVFSVAGTAGAMLRVNAFPVSYGGPDLAVRILRLDDAGTVIWERDGDDPGNTSVYRDAFLPADDTYLVVVSDAANFSPSPTAWVGGAGRDYELGVSVLPPPTAIAPSLPWTWSGSIPTSGLIQAVSATPPAGMRLEALLRSGDGVHFDPWLTVYDAAAARVVAENDDGAGGFDALVRLEATGAPLVFVIDHVFADARRPAALTLDLRELDPAAEAEPNDLAESANDLTVGATPVSGTIAAPAVESGRVVEDRDLFRFAAEAGATYAIDAVRAGGTGDLDPAVAVLRLVEGAGRLVAENPLAFGDDSPLRGDVDARVLVTARRTGPLFVEVRDARNVAAERSGTDPAAGGPEHRYTLRVSAVSAPAVVDLGTLSAPVSRDDAATVGGSADVYRFSTPAGAPLSLQLLDISAPGEIWAPLAYLTDAADAVVLLALEPPRGGQVDGWVFAAGAGGRLRVGDALGAGRAAFDYRLGLRALVAGAVTESSADNDTIAAAEALAWDAAEDGIVVAGSLDRSAGAGPDGVDVYRATVAPGGRVVAFTGPRAGDSPDTVVALRLADGTRLAENDDVPGGELLVSATSANAGADGVVFVEVSLWGAGSSGAYALFVGSP
jgi:hypothetical protein